MIDSIVKIVRGILKIRGNTDNTLIGNVSDNLKVYPAELPTFVSYVADVAIGNNKSMISILNASGSGVKIKIRDVKIINNKTTGLVGIASDFRFFRFTGHTGGTLITPQTLDTTDTLNVNVSSRTGSTISGESPNPLFRYLWSSDEWGPGTLDTESYDHALQTVFSNYGQNSNKVKPIVLNPGEGLHIKHVVNSTIGNFDFIIFFTQE